MSHWATWAITHSNVILGCRIRGTTRGIHKCENKVTAEVLKRANISDWKWWRKDILNYEQLKDTLDFKVTQLFFVYLNWRVLTYSKYSECHFLVFCQGPLTIHLIVEAIAIYNLRDYLRWLQLLDNVEVSKQSTCIINDFILIHYVVDLFNCYLLEFGLLLFGSLCFRMYSLIN